MPLNHLFSPKTIAVIGASRYKGKVGHDVFRNLLQSRKKVFPVNPKAKAILGKKAYSSILDIKEGIDLAIIAVPAKIVPDVMKECVEKKVKAAVIISSGFSETGNKELEDEVFWIAEQGKIDVLGPNCLGLINPGQKMNAAFFNKLPEKGKIAFISQSGALGVAVLDWAIQNRIGLSSFVSVGNAVDIDFTKLVDYFSAEKSTKAICLYVESLNAGRKFLKAAEKCKKPIIVLKAGKTKAGMRAAATHTAALATEDAVYEGAFKQFGIIRVQTLHQLFEVARHFVHEKEPRGKRGLIITNAGGPGVMASDAFEKNGLEIVQLPEKILQELNRILPSHWSHNNPVDIIGDALPERYKSALKTVESRFYDFLLLILTPQTMSQPLEVAEILVSFHKRTKIPCFGCFMGGDAVRNAKTLLKQNHILNFKEPAYAAEVISRMIKK